MLKDNRIIKKHSESFKLKVHLEQNENHKFKNSDLCFDNFIFVNSIDYLTA